MNEIVTPREWANCYTNEQRFWWLFDRVGRGAIITGEGVLSIEIVNGEWQINGHPTGISAEAVSPKVTTEPIPGGTKVTITDSTGDHSFDVMNGTGGGLPEGISILEITPSSADSEHPGTVLVNMSGKSVMLLSFTSESDPQVTFEGKTDFAANISVNMAPVHGVYMPQFVLYEETSGYFIFPLYVTININDFGYHQVITRNVLCSVNSIGTEETTEFTISDLSFIVKTSNDNSARLVFLDPVTISLGYVLSSPRSSLSRAKSMQTNHKLEFGLTQIKKIGGE